METSELAFLVHKTYQHHHIRPAVFMGLCTNQDPVGFGERAFMLASERFVIETGDVPVPVRALAKPSPD